MRAFLQLTKPRISLVFAFTGLAALVVERSQLTQPWHAALIIAAIFFIGGSANAFNQYFERDVDTRMQRTAKKRPLPQGRVTPRAALWFSIITGVIGVGALFWWGGWLAGSIALGTIVFYSFYYTLWLKPRTPYNIVIGGLAGATAPLIAWAAATGHLASAPLVMCAIIFFWTPPHFWALAICCKEDYIRVGYPMLPIVLGEDATRRQIMWYSLLLLPLSLLLGTPWFGNLGTIYRSSASILGVLFAVFAWRVYRQKTHRACWQLFAYSILYVMLLFVAMMMDVMVG